MVQPGLLKIYFLTGPTTDRIESSEEENLLLYEYFMEDSVSPHFLKNVLYAISYCRLKRVDKMVNYLKMVEYCEFFKIEFAKTLDFLRRLKTCFKSFARN